MQKTTKVTTNLKYSKDGSVTFDDNDGMVWIYSMSNGAHILRKAIPNLIEALKRVGEDE